MMQLNPMMQPSMYPHNQSYYQPMPDLQQQMFQQQQLQIQQLQAQLKQQQDQLQNQETHRSNVTPFTKQNTRENNNEPSLSINSNFKRMDTSPGLSVKKDLKPSIFRNTGRGSIEG
jgi:type II secretory pathway pseudopilin PulG